MLSFSVLGSGSAGNAALVEAGSTRLLIDAGLSARRITSRLADLGVDAAQLDGILVTHEHQDHAQGLSVLLKKHRVPLYANTHTAAALRPDLDGTGIEWKLFATGTDFNLGEITIRPFSVPHDAADPVGFCLHAGDACLGYLTDLGYATKLVLERIRHATSLVIETNHDEKLLHADTRRPWSIKQRILSRHGHLSNAAAAEVIASILGNGLRRVVLGHLSRDCNTPELARSTVLDRLSAEGVSHIEVHAMPHGAPGPRWEV